MDYLDPKKAARHRIIMLVGYLCIAVAIVIASLILLYQAYGFGIGKNGTVIQNGLTFFSSQPNPADIYVNGKLNKVKTNSRVVLPAGIYRITLARNGYRDWQRQLELSGGQVEHFDYPLLVPQKLISKKLAAYPTGSPSFSTQSPDRRWFIISQVGSMTAFDVYDLKNPTKPPVAISLPATIVSKATGSESWQLVEWSDDNQHVLMQHSYDAKSEYILFSRTSPETSVNLSTTLPTNPPQISLRDKKYDQYYLFDSSTGSLQTASLNSTTPILVQQHVLAYKSYGSQDFLYATTEGAAAEKVLIKLQSGQTSYPIRSFPAGTTYLLDLTKYGNVPYAVTGATSQDKVYIYKDPIAQLNNRPGQAVFPAQVLHLPQPNYINFSTNAQYVMAENGQQFGVYDVENKLGYKYATTKPLDPPQTHASWMDGNRLIYASGGKLAMLDFDNTNHQTLVSLQSSHLPAFAPNYKFVYTLAPNSTSIEQTELDQTNLLVPPDR